MPVTATLSRPAFSDVDSLSASRFNGVTVLTVTVPDATSASEGVVRLAGDLTGTASSPQLAVSGVAAGTYGAADLKVASITVDAKGRVTAASERDLILPTVPDAATATTGASPTPAVKGILALAGDLVGTSASPQLIATGVSAGSYGTADQALETVADPAALAALTVLAADIGRRIVRVTSTGNYHLAAVAGSGADKWQAHTPITNGVFTIATVTFDTKGRATTAGYRNLVVPEASSTVAGLLRLSGDLTGTPASPQLVASGVSAGQYGVIETVANPAALAALTVAADDVGRRLVRVTSTNVIWRATTAGTGADKWTQPTSVTFDDLVLVRQTYDTKGRATAAEAAPVSLPSGLPSAWVQFDGNSTANFRTALAYSRASNVVTVTAPAHGFRVGDRVSCDFTSGSGVADGLYAVETVPNADTFTFTLAGVNTGGNVTLEIFATRNTRNVHSVVKDRRYGAASYWVNFLNALANDTFLVNAQPDSSDGFAIVDLNQTGGVRAQDARGCSLRSVVYSDGSAAWAQNISVLVFGG